jgi:hypothetical protein
VFTIHHSEITDKEERWWNGRPALYWLSEKLKPPLPTTWEYFLEMIKKTVGSVEKIKKKALKNPM